MTIVDLPSNSGCQVTSTQSPMMIEVASSSLLSSRAEAAKGLMRAAIGHGIVDWKSESEPPSLCSLLGQQIRRFGASCYE
jgi:hypothetical protein